MRNDKDVAFTPGAPLQGRVAAGASERDASSRIDQSGSEMSDRLHDRVEHAKDLAGNVGHRVADTVEDRLSDQRLRAADSLGQVAHSLRSAGQQMPSENGLGRYVSQAADRVDDLAGFIKEHEISELVDNFEDMARRQPAAFLGGAFALGLVGARFLKSSRHRLESESYHARQHRYSAEPRTGGYHAPDLSTTQGMQGESSVRTPMEGLDRSSEEFR